MTVRTSKVAPSALDGVLATSLEGTALRSVVVGFLAVRLSDDIPDGGGPVDVVCCLPGNRNHGRLVRHCRGQDGGWEARPVAFDNLRGSFVWI
jgi:hypothetical protein